MSERFFERPILNSPYECPTKHWELDESGQPTHQLMESRRKASFVTPVPKPKRQKGTFEQSSMIFDKAKEISTGQQQYNDLAIINAVRDEVAQWRQISDPSEWRVTPETQRLLEHWRHHDFIGIRPFFCQLEAVEVAIWLTEVAPTLGQKGKRFLEHLENSNAEANPGLSRLALKLATGAGKTTVMAMLIAWQTINAVRRPNSKRFTCGFLIIAPGITIRDRLQVLMPNDPNSYYKRRELVPSVLMNELNKAKIKITNYHAFKQRETIEISKGGRALLEGRQGEKLQTSETVGEMLRRIMPELMGLKNIVVINDEAHHCYRAKPNDEDESLKGDDKQEAEKNREAAHLWISGIEAANLNMGVSRVFDLSATPFFLAGSGYAEGTLFPWVMSDFSLMDAIECGIVKLPRIPVAQNIPTDDMPMFRELWQHIGRKMPKKGRRNAGPANPLDLPVELQTALQALYLHYEETYNLWMADEGLQVPPCFIVVCNNTATSKLVYDYISGFERQNSDGTVSFEEGRLSLFRNFDANGDPIARPRTLLIDSEQLESGEGIDKSFRKIAGAEIERFKREALERGGDLANRIRTGKDIDDATLMREVMNTVGKREQLGESIRCVVSVSMLTEGWDANTVTHVLGVRAFGTQLLCEQVVGRALRRQSYVLNDEDLLDVEYADILGIPFNFTAEPVISRPQKPNKTINVKAVLPERSHLEIAFPLVRGYRVDLPEDRLTHEFTETSVLVLTPDDVGPTSTKNSGIIGVAVDLTLKGLEDMRRSTLIYTITNQLVRTHWCDADGNPKLHLFGQLKRVVKQWLEKCLVCKGGTYPALLTYQALGAVACERITAAITRAEHKKMRPIKAILDPYNARGSTIHVNFNTSKTNRWKTEPDKCQINWVILESGWEGEFCRIAEAHSKVRSYVKNYSLGFEVPYLMGGRSRIYLPDYIVQLDDGHGEENLLNLVVEIKGYRGEDAKQKKETMETYWIPGVNNLKSWGRWAFAEFTDVYEMQDNFESEINSRFTNMVSEMLVSSSKEKTNG